MSSQTRSEIYTFNARLNSPNGGYVTLEGQTAYDFSACVIETGELEGKYDCVYSGEVQFSYHDFQTRLYILGTLYIFTLNGNYVFQSSGDTCKESFRLQGSGSLDVNGQSLPVTVNLILL